MRRWLILLAGCLAVAVAVPVIWWSTRPSSAAGSPVVGAVGQSTAPATGTRPPAPAGTDPAAAVRAATVPPVLERPGPARVQVPDLGIEAEVVPVGVRSDGSMAIPTDVRQVGWYRYGPRPGDPAGATVLAGHVDSKEQGRGAMFRIRDLEPGDLIEVRTDAGKRIGYRVVAKETIVKKRLPTERLFARDGPARLVLITCGGPFLPQLSSYRDNLVVVAEPVPAVG